MALAFLFGALATACGKNMDASAQQPASEAQPLQGTGGRASPGGGITLKLANYKGGEERYLTDSAGRALYLFTSDKEGKSTCYGPCAEAWPPLLNDGKPVATGSGVKADLIGTIERDGGKRQVTYGGHPLYYYQRDQNAGDTSGQDMHHFNAEWYLVTPEGKKLEAE